ncbi:MAG: tetratricopeptide repeat protein [Thermoanaerobaculales bacterium]|nr:tetratricopeptide repeat protein [Thermoanaerobaculales bacterium]
MRTVNRSVIFFLCMAALVAITNDAAAQAGGRISGKVADQAGQPIEGVQVTAISPGRENFKLEKTTNKKGKFTLAFADSTASYVLELKKEGYQTIVVPVNPVPGQTRLLEYVLLPATGDDQATADRAALTGTGRAILVYNEGVEAQRAGDLELAAKKYNEAASLNAELAAPHTSLAAIAHMRGDYPEAASEAEKALAIEPTDVRAMQIRYDAYRLAGDKQNAKEAEQALRELGGLSETAARIFNEGADAYNSGDMASAISKFQEAADLDPALVQARLVLAKLFFSEGNLSQALARAEEVVALEPDNGEALRIAYDSARRLGDAEKAANALDGLAESDPEWAATGLFELAVELYNNDQIEDAAQALERVLQVKPDHARAHYLLGVAQFNTGQTDMAMEHLRQFIELTPDDPDAAIARDLLSYSN